MISTIPGRPAAEAYILTGTVRFGLPLALLTTLGPSAGANNDVSVVMLAVWKRLTKGLAHGFASGSTNHWPSSSGYWTGSTSSAAILAARFALQSVRISTHQQVICLCGNEDLWAAFFALQGELVVPTMQRYWRGSTRSCSIISWMADTFRAYTKRSQDSSLTSNVLTAPTFLIRSSFLWSHSPSSWTRAVQSARTAQS